MALNDGLAWPIPGADYVTKAFLGGTADKKLLSAGMKLCKFTDQRTIINPKTGNASPWWFATDAFGEFDLGLEAVLKFAAANGVSSTEYARLIAAVTEEWNKMDVIMHARLKANVNGFWGQCAMQSKKEGSKVNLTGRGWQFYIPGLTDEHIEQLGPPVPAPAAPKK